MRRLCAPTTKYIIPKQQIIPRLGGAACVAPDALEALRKQARRIEGVAKRQRTTNRLNEGCSSYILKAGRWILAQRNIACGSLQIYLPYTVALRIHPQMFRFILRARFRPNYRPQSNRLPEPVENTSAYAMTFTQAHHTRHCGRRIGPSGERGTALRPQFVQQRPAIISRASSVSTSRLIA